MMFACHRRQGLDEAGYAWNECEVEQIHAGRNGEASVGDGDCLSVPEPDDGRCQPGVEDGGATLHLLSVSFFLSVSSARVVP